MLELTETEKIGLRIIALIRAGQLNAFKCSVCNEQMQEHRNCAGEDKDIPVFYHPEVGEFFACPLTFIPNSIHLFLDKYDYIEKYPATAATYEQVNPRFWASVKFYENFKYELEEKTTENKNDSVDNRSKMKSLFNKEI